MESSVEWKKNSEIKLEKMKRRRADKTEEKINIFLHVPVKYRNFLSSFLDKYIGKKRLIPSINPKLEIATKMPKTIVAREKRP